METNIILSNIIKHVILSQDQITIIVDLLEEKIVKKNAYLLKQGSGCNHIYFVNTGLLRAFCLSPNGKESTVMFAIKDWWITDMYCFLNNKPAMVGIKAMKDSVVLALSREGLDELFDKIPEFNIFFRILMQNAYCREQLRMIQNLTLPAKERYENFLLKYPVVAQVVPLKHIASYVGVTPEFLSSIRSPKKNRQI